MADHFLSEGSESRQDFRQPTQTTETLHEFRYGMFPSAARLSKKSHLARLANISQEY